MARPTGARRSPSGVRTAAGADVETMKVAGVLLCASAVLSLVAAAVIRGAPGGAATGTSFGGAFVVLLFGAGLYQGAGAARIFVLLCAGLGALACLVTVPMLNSARELQVLLVAVLLTCAGYLVLLASMRASRGRVVAGVALVVAGAAGSLASRLWLGGLERRVFARELRPLLAPDREYRDASSGLSMVVPAGWSLIEPNAAAFVEVPAKVKLADPDAGTVAFINHEPQPARLLSLDHYLDTIIQAQRDAGLAPQEKDRRDTAVGKAPARRMSLSWVHAERPYSGFVSAWTDGPRIYTLFGAAVGKWTDANEGRFRDLEAALRFSAPVETALSEVQSRLTRECPVFTEESVRIIARRIPPSSPAESYFVVGWSLALRGQGQLPAAAADELRVQMGEVFSRMSATDRGRFGAYNERVRGGRATAPVDDAAAMRILGRAAATLPGEALAKLRILVESSVAVGALR